MRKALALALAAVGLAACGGSAPPPDRVRVNTTLRMVVCDQPLTCEHLVAPGGKYAGFGQDSGPREYDSSYGR